MSNMRQVPIGKADMFILEGDLMNVNNGEFPITYIGLRFEDAPEEQIWILNKPFFGYFNDELEVVSSHDLAFDKMKEMIEKKSINLVDDFETISSFEVEYKPYGSDESEMRSSIHIVKSFKNTGTELQNQDEQKRRPRRKNRI